MVLCVKSELSPIHMIENNTTLCLFQCISILVAKIIFFKKNSTGGKINFFGGFVHISRTYIGLYCLPLPVSQNLTGVRPTLRTCKFILF